VRRPSDEQLILDHCAGLSGAMDQLLVRYQDRVFQFVRWRTGAVRADAEDLAQDVFLEVFRSAGAFDGRSRFRTWLYAVAGHVCNKWLRSKARRQELGTVGGAGGAAALAVADLRPNALDDLQRQERDQTVRQTVESLAGPQRVVLLLRDWEDLTYEEMSVVLEVPVGTVKSRVHHARLNLARRLAPVLGREVEA